MPGGWPRPRARSPGVREWLREGHPPDLATVERVLAVAAGAAPGTDIGAGRSVRRSKGVLRLEAPPGRDAGASWDDVCGVGDGLGEASATL